MRAFVQQRCHRLCRRLCRRRRRARSKIAPGIRATQKFIKPARPRIDSRRESVKRTGGRGGCRRRRKRWGESEKEKEREKKKIEKEERDRGGERDRNNVICIRVRESLSSYRRGTSGNNG